MASHPSSYTFVHFVNFCQLMYIFISLLVSEQGDVIWPRGYQTFFMLNSFKHEFFLLINVKMPTIVGILTVMSGKIAF